MAEDEDANAENPNTLRFLIENEVILLNFANCDSSLATIVGLD